ncbi:hypothetical protein T484DRAFT_1884982, partial [Baffinella frigidus]
MGGMRRRQPRGGGQCLVGGRGLGGDSWHEPKDARDGAGASVLRPQENGSNNTRQNGSNGSRQPPRPPGGFSHSAGVGSGGRDPDCSATGARGAVSAPSGHDLGGKEGCGRRGEPGEGGWWFGERRRFCKAGRGGGGSAYWEAVRRAGGLLLSSGFDPASLPPLAPDAASVQVNSLYMQQVNTDRGLAKCLGFLHYFPEPRLLMSGRLLAHIHADSPAVSKAVRGLGREACEAWLELHDLVLAPFEDPSLLFAPERKHVATSQPLEPLHSRHGFIPREEKKKTTTTFPRASVAARTAQNTTRGTNWETAPGEVDLFLLRRRAKANLSGGQGHAAAAARVGREREGERGGERE